MPAAPGGGAGVIPSRLSWSFNGQLRMISVSRFVVFHLVAAAPKLTTGFGGRQRRTY